MKLHYKGKYDLKTESLPYGEHVPGAGKFKEAENSKKLSLIANILCIVIMGIMANGAVYTDSKEVCHIHDRKLDALEDIIEAANGNPILVAYWYQHDLDRITARLRKLKVKHERLTTEESIRKWNKGEITVGLIGA